MTLDVQAAGPPAPSCPPPPPEEETRSPWKEVGRGGQVRWLWFPTVATHPAEPGHQLPPSNQTPWPGEATMQLLIGGLRATATGGCLPTCRQELRLQRDPAGRRGGLVVAPSTWAQSGRCQDEQLRHVGLAGCLAHRPLWAMLHLGAPRARGCAPLGRTRQVGLSKTEVPQPS